MSKIKDIQIQIKALQEKLNELSSFPQNMRDTAMTYVSDAQDESAMSNMFDNNNNTLIWTIKKLQNWILPTEDNFVIEYWIEINRLVDMLIARAKFTIKDKKFRRQINNVFRNAFLFMPTAVDKVTKKSYTIMSYDASNDTYELYDGLVTPDNLLFSGTSIGLKGVKPAQKITVKGDTIAVLDFWWDGIPMYVKLVPYLGKYLYFRRCRDKNESFCQVVADTSKIGREKLPFLTDAQCFNVIDKSVDMQHGSAKPNAPRTESMIDKIVWYAPSENAKLAIEINHQSIDKAYEELMNYIGIETQAIGNPTSGEGQDLAAEANQAQKPCELFRQSWITTFYEFVEDLNGNEENSSNSSDFNESSVNTQENEKELKNEPKNEKESYITNGDEAISNKNEEKEPQENGSSSIKDEKDPEEANEGNGEGTMIELAKIDEKVEQVVIDESTKPQANGNDNAVKDLTEVERSEE